jgi:GT2 family glycosyltransferase
MNKFGIIFCGYNQEEHVEESLSSFLNDERFIVACVSVPFQEYISFDFEDSTTEKLKNLHAQGKFKYFLQSL